MGAQRSSTLNNLRNAAFSIFGIIDPDDKDFFANNKSRISNCVVQKLLGAMSDTNPSQKDSYVYNDKFPPVLYKDHTKTLDGLFRWSGLIQVVVWRNFIIHDVY